MSDAPHSRAWARAEQVARASYGRLVAVLAAPSGDLESAEDWLAEAFAQALRTWPLSGIPDNPEGWLVAVARNRERDVARSPRHRATLPFEDSSQVRAIAVPPAPDPDGIPDGRLSLLFVCAHPAVDPGARTPLMLQVVLGFEAREIARAFTMPTATLAQRLVRAKRRIRDARIPFAIPGRVEMPARLAAVLEAIYGAYAIDWHLVAGTTVRPSLATEAHHLAVLLAELMPNEPEALGLAALLSLSLARARARELDVFVPLDEQDASLWDAQLIREGEAYLHRAHPLGRIGRFQLEAAIQSAHLERARTGRVDWSAVRALYDALVALAPTLGARVARAAALARAEDPGAGLAALDAIGGPAVQRFQPAWATRAHLLSTAGRTSEAVAAYGKALSLTTDPRERAYLRDRLERLDPASAAPGHEDLRP